MPGENSFGKAERLSSGREIERLFSAAQNFKVYPYRISWRINKKEKVPGVKILISVPKKNLSRAVDRNLIKRRTREAYRNNKEILLDIIKNKKSLCLELGFVYNGKDLIEYHEIESKIISALKNLAELI